MDLKKHLLLDIINKKQKWILAIFITLLIISISLLFILTYTSKPFTLTENSTLFSVLPPLYWVLTLLNFIFIFTISRFIKNKKLLFSLLILDSCTSLFLNYIFFIPVGQSDINSVTKYLTVLNSSNNIGITQINIDSYFQWPIYFIFAKIIMLVFNTDISTTIKIGYSLFNILFTFFITFFLIKLNISIKNIFYILPIYNILSYHFIVLQFAQQTLALLYTILIFILFISIEKINVKSLLYIIYIALIFTHPFFFIFFITSILIEITLFKNKKKIININLFLSLLAIYLISYKIFFSSINSQFIDLISNVGLFKSETWTTIFSFLGLKINNQTSATYPFYNLVNIQYLSLLANISRLILLSFIGILMIDGLIMLKEKQLFKTIKQLDISIMISTLIFWIIGLFSSFLGQRSLQVFFIPVAKSYNYIIKKSTIMKSIILLLIIISPIVFSLTSWGDTFLTGSYSVKDFEMEKSGQIIDKFALSDQKVLAANNGFPTGYPSGLKIYYVQPGYFEYINITNKTSNMDLILYTPKMNMLIQYYGIQQIKKQNLLNNNVLYNNKNTICINPLHVIK